MPRGCTIRSEYLLVLEMRQELREDAERLSQKLSSSDEQYRTRTAKSIEEAVETSRQAVKSLEEGFERRVNFVRYDLIYFRIGLYKEMKKQPSTMVTEYIKLLEIASALSWDSSLQSAFEGIKTALTQGGKVTTFEFDQVTDLLEKVPKKYSLDVEQIRQLLPSARFSPT